MPAPKYTYTSLDWLTKEVVLDNLPLTDVKFNDPVDLGGSLSGNLALDRQTGDRLDALDPCRRLILVTRNDYLAWIGWVWTTKWSSKDKRLEFSAGDYDTYLSRRIVRDYLRYEGQDKLDIADDLMSYMMTQVGGNIGVTLGPHTPSGAIVPELTFLPEQGTRINAALKSLGSDGDGFDYSFEPGMTSGGLVQVTWNKHYPYRGVTPDNAQLVLEYPGNVISYDWPVDGTAFSNFLWGIGGSANSSTSATDGGLVFVQAPEVDPDPTPYPLLEDPVTYSDLSDPDLLQDQINEDYRLRSKPVEVPSLVVRGDKVPLESCRPGDWAVFYVKDRRHSQGREVMVRIVDVAVTPASNNKVEEITLSLDTAELA